MVLVGNNNVYTIAKAQINARNIVWLFHAKELKQKFVRLFHHCQLRSVGATWLSETKAMWK